MGYIKHVSPRGIFCYIRLSICLFGDEEAGDTLRKMDMREREMHVRCCILLLPLCAI
jgi:hypothetical protein